MPPQKNHFATLGVEIGAEEEEIKKAYRKLAKQWHPDKNKHPQAEDKFKEINASYEFLSSKDRREIHERELRNSKPSPKQSQPSQSQSSTRTASCDHNNSNNTGKPKGSKKDDKPKRPSSAPKAKGKKKSNDASWSETFTKTFGQKKAQEKAPKETKESFSFSKSNADDDVFSFIFESFDDKRPSHKKEDVEDNLKSHFKPTNIFHDDFFWTVNFGAGFNQPPKTFSEQQWRQTNVFPESGNAMGLDDEYLFTPGHNRRHDDGAAGGKKASCRWCGKRFPSSQLDQHEDSCGKFDLSEDGDTEDINSDLDDVDDLFIPSERIHNPRPSWQQQHEEHIEKVRRDKLRYKDRMASQGKRNSGFVLCPYCERSFNQNAAARHIPFCKEHFTTFGRPLNVKPSHSRIYKTEDQSDQEARRSRAYKCDTGHSGPTIDPFYKPKFSEDGNRRKFPQPKPEMNMDDILGVNGKGFSTSNTTETNPRCPKPSYAEIHRSREGHTPPKDSFFKTAAQANGGRHSSRTGYSGKKL